MRVAKKHGLHGLALALAFALTPAVVPAPASAISLEVPHVLGIHIETPPLPVEVKVPTIEVPGVVKVQTSSSSSQGGEAPTNPVEVKVNVPTTPTVGSTPEVPSTPTTGTTLPELPKQTASSGGESTGSEKRTTASAASTTGTSGGGQATPTAAATPTNSSTATRVQAAESPLERRAKRSARRRSAGAEGDARTAGATATTTPVGSSPAPTAARAHTPSGQAHKASSSSDPLTSIGRQIPLPLPVPDWSKPIILLLLLLAIFFGARSQLAAVRARRLERQRAELLSDVDEMQAALVPQIPQLLGGLSVSVAYRPADGPAAGGDFYDLFTLGPDKVAIVLGDVAGHGRGALQQAALTRYTLRAYLQAGLEPRAALALAGSVLAEPGDRQFATVVVAIHDSAAGTLTYASAGHPPPIASGFETPEPLTICCSAPLCCDLPTGRRQTTIPLPANGSVCFFSDGLLEARVEDGELLGREHLIELVDAPGATATASALLERVRDVATATPDDMCACIVSPAAHTPTHADTVEELEVDAQTLSTPRVRLFLEACGLSASAAAALLAQADKIVEVDSAALLRIAHPQSDKARATAHIGSSAPAWASTESASGSETQTLRLALPSSR